MEVGQFAALAGSAERLTWLGARKRAGGALPLGLVIDALCLQIPLAEKQRLLDLADVTDAASFEAVLLTALPLFDQDLAALALAAWLRRSPRHQWRRLLDLPSAALPERVVEFVVDHCGVVGGAPLLCHVLAGKEPQELPGPTQAVMFRRLTQWSLVDERAMATAERLLLRTVETAAPASPATVFAAEYVARFQPENLFHLLSHPIGPRLWADHLQALYQGIAGAEAQAERLRAFLTAPPAAAVDFYRRFFQLWPPVWLRHQLPADVVALALAQVASRPVAEAGGLPVARAPSWELFGGIDTAELAGALAKAPDSVTARHLLGTLLPDVEPRAASASSPGAADAASASAPGAAAAAGGAAISLISDDLPRSAFFDHVFRDGAFGIAVPAGPRGSPWLTLLAALQDKSRVPAKDLLAAGRQLPPLYLQCFCAVLERMKSDDRMLPALVDQVHGREAGDLTAVAQALIGIGTGQALVQVVRMLGRANVPFDVKVEIAASLASVDLTACQSELRGIVDALRRNGIARTARDSELLDALRSLLKSEPKDLPALEMASAAREDLDREIRRFVPGMDKLPPEALRALRTSRLIARTMTAASRADGMDISPTVDLQYKGLELLFRHILAPMVTQLIQAPTAILQRKLELIGYGRSGRTRVEAFESYLGAMPVIADIPQFSRFKLNKVLGGIAHHRPGRRFVLDGIKAYAMVFLAFSRSRCEFGLDRLLPLGLPSDRALLEFCRDLHMFHDVRNEAVHEGLPAEFMKDSEALWGLTGSIVERALAIVDAAPRGGRS